MLKQIGIDSYYVVIDTDRGMVNPKFPSIGSFNHVILAIRLPDSVTDAGLYAVFKDPKLGRLLFFDPTNPYVPLGYIPSYLQDTYALLVTPDGGQLVSLPLLPPATNRLLAHRRVQRQRHRHSYRRGRRAPLGWSRGGQPRAISQSRSGRPAKGIRRISRKLTDEFFVDQRLDRQPRKIR